MNIILIASLSLLAGIAMAGFVWYVWGLVENIWILRKMKAIEAENRRLEKDAVGADTDMEA